MTFSFRRSAVLLTIVIGGCAAPVQTYSDSDRPALPATIEESDRVSAAR